MKAVKDLFEVNKRVRLIVGLNEENDWECIKHYKKVEEMPTIGFSPDADFPCIYAEKGLLSVYISKELDENENIKIENIDTKNNAINVVPKYCSISLEIKDKLLLDKINSDILEIAKEKSFEIKTNVKEKSLKIESFGKAAHAAHPELGINAISRLVLVLNKAFKLNNINVKEEVVLNVESNTISELTEKIKYLEEQLNKLKIEKEKSLQLQENLNKEIISLKEQLYNCSLEKEKEIQNQNNLNDFYTSKTNELEEDIKNLNESIGSIIKEKENLNNSNVLKINDLEKNITKLNNDNKKLMEENNLCLSKLSNIKTPSNSNLVFYLKFVFLFLILLLLALLIRRKIKK